MTTSELVNFFFTDLKKYNPTNFKNLWIADLTGDIDNPIILKSFSSVITRYMIFREKHPEITREENNILYYKLKLDLVAKFFSEYPDTTADNLVAFQIELKSYLRQHPEVCKDSEKLVV